MFRMCVPEMQGCGLMCYEWLPSRIKCARVYYLFDVYLESGMVLWKFLQSEDENGKARIGIIELW